MEERRTQINQFLVETFDEILKTEETSLAARFTDLSLRELHLIEAVCRAEDGGLDNRSSAIAAGQRVTAGTLTTSASLLEKKGYVERRRDERDRRAVRIFPTEKGRGADRIHGLFHREMVEEIVAVLTDQEAQVLIKALDGLTAFFREKYRGQTTAHSS